MKLTQMNALVRNELAGYPRGPRGSEQNAFRMLYALYRMNSLGERAEIADSAVAARIAAVRFMRRRNAGFVPNTSH